MSFEIEVILPCLYLLSPILFTHLIRLYSGNQKSKSLTLTIQQAQETVDSWTNQKGVRYFSEFTNIVILIEEEGSCQNYSKKIRRTIV